MNTPIAFSCAKERMLQAAFASNSISAAERIDRLQTNADMVGDLLMTGAWKEDVLVAPYALGAAATAACAPSLARVITGRPQDKASAEQVVANLRNLAADILDSPLRPHTDHRIKGQLSELAVLSTLWWGTLTTDVSGKYALPATLTQDKGEQQGRRNGVDIVIRQNGKRERQLVQVKTNRGGKGRHSLQSYRPDIAIIAPPDLVAESARTKAIMSLLGSLARNRSVALGLAYSNAKALLNQSKTAGRHYRDYQKNLQ